MAALWGGPASNNSPVGIVLLDIDRFKPFNDAYGHTAGDSCIVDVARCVEAEARGGADLAVHFGGEELIMVLRDCDLPLGRAVAERVRASVEALAIPHLHGVSGVVTVSLGVASVVPFDLVTPEELIASADVALYAAKRTGRNQVRPSAPPGSERSSPDSGSADRRIARRRARSPCTPSGVRLRASPPGLGDDDHAREVCESCRCASRERRCPDVVGGRAVHHRSGRAAAFTAPASDGTSASLQAPRDNRCGVRRPWQARRRTIKHEGLRTRGPTVGVPQRRRGSRRRGTPSRRADRAPERACRASHGVTSSTSSESRTARWKRIWRFARRAPGGGNQRAPPSYHPLGTMRSIARHARRPWRLRWRGSCGAAADPAECGAQNRRSEVRRAIGIGTAIAARSLRPWGA